jgi:uncharacterized membrane protein
MKQGKTPAILAYITILGWIAGLVMNQQEKSPFASYHLRQGLGLFLTGFAFSFINIIPLLGQVVFLIGLVVLFIMWINGLLNALNEKEKPVLFLGEYYNKWFHSL